MATVIANVSEQPVAGNLRFDAKASPGVFGPLGKLSYTVGDFIDRHGYFECNHRGDNAAWSCATGTPAPTGARCASTLRTRRNRGNSCLP